MSHDSLATAWWPPVPPAALLAMRQCGMPPRPVMQELPPSTCHTCCSSARSQRAAAASSVACGHIVQPCCTIQGSRCRWPDRTAAGPGSCSSDRSPAGPSQYGTHCCSSPAASSRLSCLPVDTAVDRTSSLFCRGRFSKACGSCACQAALPATHGGNGRPSRAVRWCGRPRRRQASRLTKRPLKTLSFGSKASSARQIRSGGSDGGATSGTMPSPLCRNVLISSINLILQK